jgi:DNA-binding MarR family transcriptional regulator
VEAATRSKRSPRSTDRQLAVRLGTLFLHVMSSDGGATFRVIDESGLSFIQVKAVLELATRGDEQDLNVKLIAERLGISVPSASRGVDGLVKGGFAVRVEDPDDRRVRRISLTEAGQELADRVMSARVSGLEGFVAGLSAAERRKLEAALEVLHEREEFAEINRAYARRVHA